MSGAESLFVFTQDQGRVILIDGHQSDDCFVNLVFVFAPPRLAHPGVSGFKASFNNCKGGQHIRNRGSDHTGQHNYTCHDTFFAAVVGAERTCIAAVTVPLPLGLSRKLPAAKSSHRYGDSVHCIHGNNSHDSLLHTVVADGSAVMVRSSIGKKIRNDQRS